MTDIRAYANADHALVVWRPGRLTAASRGFAIERRYVDDAGAAMGDPVPLENWTGWEGDKVPPGTLQAEHGVAHPTAHVGRLLHRARQTGAVPSRSDERRKGGAQARASLRV